MPFRDCIKFKATEKLIMEVFTSYVSLFIQIYLQQIVSTCILHSKNVARSKIGFTLKWASFYRTRVQNTLIPWAIILEYNASQFASSLEEIEIYEWDSMEQMKRALGGSGNSNYCTSISHFSDGVTKNGIFSISKRLKAKKNCDHFLGEV